MLYHITKWNYYILLLKNYLSNSSKNSTNLWEKDNYIYPFNVMDHSRKHPYHPHRGNWKLISLPPSDVLIHLLLWETIFSPLPLWTAEISSVGGVWIFSGTTQYIYGTKNIPGTITAEMKRQHLNSKGLKFLSRHCSFFIFSQFVTSFTINVQDSLYDE
jgi:hypothetical protein